MDMEVFIRSVLDFIGKSNNFSYLAYSVLVCVLTEIVKKIFVKKVAVDVMHKFDVAVILPFIFGTLLAFADALCEVGLAFAAETVYNALVEGCPSVRLPRLFSSLARAFPVTACPTC